MNKWLISLCLIICVAVGYWVFFRIAPVTDNVLKPENLSETYADPESRFSIRYPKSYTADPQYLYQALDPDKIISGVKFVVPASLAEGTNLSKDSFLSVEHIPDTVVCSAKLFLGSDLSYKEEIVTEGVMKYSRASAGGAGAGNFYEEIVYAIPSTNPCLGIRYFIHSTNIGNYPPGTVREFNRTALITQFDAIRRTLNR